jgi:ribonuclease R
LTTKPPKTLDRDEVLKALRLGPAAGYKTHELSDRLSADQKGRHRLRRLLADLVDENAIEKAEGGRYRLVGLAPPLPQDTAAKKKGQVTGQLRVHPAGYGFVVRDDGEDDVFVAARHRENALDGDRVALTTWLGYKGTEGHVEEVLARGRAKVTGTLRGHGRGAHLEPDDPRILASSAQVSLEGGAGHAKDGQAVVVEITRYPRSADEPLTGRVARVLGDPDDPRTEVEKIIVCADIPDEFPDEVRAAGERAPTMVRPEDLVDRVDLRSRAFLTIDPETARDFDDAVCVEDGDQPGHARLWVAVADVSHYVRPGSALDREARIRGCSVYLPNRAIPMLPEQLSSGMCSLNPEVDRLAMVARMEVGPKGHVSDPYFCAAVIRSRARLDYPGVAAALAGDLRGPRARYREFLPALKQMAEVSARLRHVRSERGSLDFDLPEAKVVLDDDDPKRVRDVVKSRANPEVKGAYQLIEDFMLAANEAVARHFRGRRLDTMWRVHDIPSDERLEQFAEIAHAFGLSFDPEDGRTPRKLRDFLETLRGKPQEPALNFLLLRALKQAVYDVINVGHFGLAAPDYVHFTSPIRRYPDLIVHRLLKHALKGDGLPAGGPPPSLLSRETIQEMAGEASRCERRAMEAEREVVDLYRAVLMRDRVGDEFEGRIAGVASFGFFVQIDVPFVEGLVKVSTLGGDAYNFDENAMRLVGARSGRAFSLGDTVKVRIENVSVSRRKIDLVVVDHTMAEPMALTEVRRGRGPKDRRRGRQEGSDRERHKGDGRRGRGGRRR